MSRGAIARAGRRYPDARRRAARYGRGQIARRPTTLPPHLLPGVTGRDQDDSTGTRLGIGAAFLVVTLVATLGAILFTVISTAAGVGATVAAYRQVKEDLPNAGGVYADIFQTTRVLDRNGKLLWEIAEPGTGGWRTYVPLEKIAADAIDATVASEDATFWNHRGVEPVAVARGLLINTTGSGSSGASTITQQLMRGIHPEKIGNDYTYTRKAREMLAAVAVEREYPKHDILSMYLNLIFYGNRSYGIEAAARTYFHKSAADLTLSESALLAGIPQLPTDYNPSLNPELAKRRQAYVLDQMLKLGYITVAERDAAARDWPRIYPEREGDGTVLDHPHFVQYVREYLDENFSQGVDPDDPTDDVDFTRGGFDIYTTIDSTLQDRAEEIIRTQVDSQLTFYGASNAAAVVMVPYTGEVLAMVGSKDFNQLDIEGQVNIATSMQQPGSAIKPIVYAAAFEQGWHPGTVVLDAPFRRDTPGATDPATGLPDPFYEPQNYLRTFNGAVTVRTSLSNSLNIPAIKAVDYAGGPEAIVDIARRMGIVHEPRTLDGELQKPEDNGLSIGLGSRDVWPLELTNAYATFANNGTFVPANPILKITDSDGDILYEIDREKSLEQATPAIRPEIAYQITSILTDSTSRRLIFGPGNLFETIQTDLRRPTAAKSGTTNDFKDIWTMGYTTDVAVGVWVGNTRNAPLSQPIDGIQGAGPIWAQLMKELHSRPEFSQLLLGPNGQPIPPDFPRPPTIYEGIVCEATGGQPTEVNGNRQELLIRGGAPYQRCDQLSAWARADLAETLATLREKGGPFSGNGQGSIDRYARMVGFFNTGGKPVYVPPDAPGSKTAGE